MSENTIDAKLCSRMFLAGARSLDHSKEWINELNVFPVPDGDTGTNMTMTIQSAANEVKAIEDLTMAKLCKAMSSGSLRGARGNSGVILSQLLRGFCKVTRDHEVLTVEILRNAFERAVETAYKAVMKPKEGTILTVARGFSDEASRLLEENPEIGMEEFLAGAITHADEVLAQTPEMLPVLKEAGVVDSGGQGLMQILKGAYDLYTGNESALAMEAGAEEAAEEVKEESYCVQFSVHPSGGSAAEAVSALQSFFSSAEDVEGFDTKQKDSEVLVHAHLLHPGLLIEKAISLGRLSGLQFFGLSEHECSCSDAFHSGKNAQGAADGETSSGHNPADGAPDGEAAGEHKEVGFVAVAAGEGLCGIFKDLGADCMIEGGQTMNPSTEDVINAIRSVNADAVFVLPNNKNIILAATQAQSMIKDRKVFVIPTKTIPQGISSLIAYSYELSPEENEKLLYEEIKLVKTCQVTYAVRDTCIADRNIHEGDIMGVGDKGILAVGEDIVETSIASVEAMVDDDSELISIYYGRDIREESAEELTEKIRERWPDCEVELNCGGQPVYYYILSVE